jgi:hypothetical protein
MVLRDAVAVGVDPAKFPGCGDIPVAGRIFQRFQPSLEVACLPGRQPS